MEKECFIFASVEGVANDMLMLAGFVLLLMQLHGYLHSVNTEEFGFNKDAHYHIHEEMDAAKNRYQHDEL